MADNEDGEERTSRGNEWEVVTLTASTYEAAPGSGHVESKDDEQGAASMQDEAETSRALFLSRHFVFPPSEHENLPVESEYSEILGESGGKDVSEVIVDDGARPSGKKDEENVMISGINVSEVFSDVPYFDDNMSKLSVHGKQFAEGTALEDFGLIGKEKSMYDTAKYSSLRSESDFGVAPTYGDEIVVSETVESAEQEPNTSLDISNSKTSSKDDKCHPLDLPCEAWWKRRASALYAHAKETNAYWSIFIAAAVMGLVMLGQRWQQERAYQLQLHGSDEVCPLL